MGRLIDRGTGTNTNLHEAKRGKNDEFYTPIEVVNNELRHYDDHFRGKVILCNCDDPEESKFWWYFKMKFHYLGLKKLIATHFDYIHPTYKLETSKVAYTGEIAPGDLIKTPLKSNGDFRSEECIELLKESDVVVTNPPFSCYSADTEVFTNRGWLLFADVKSDDLVCSLNMASNAVEFVGIKGVIRRHVDEPLLRFKNRRVDLLVTHDHRMIARSRNHAPVVVDANGGEQLIPASKIKAHHTCPVKGFNWIGEHVEHFVLPAITQLEQFSRKEVRIAARYIRMEHWLEFFGMWLADGCCRRGRNSQGNNRYTVSVKQREANDAYIRQLYANIGFDCTVEPNKTGNHNYTVYSKQLWSYLCQFGKSRDKYIPAEYLALDRSMLKCLYTGYINGDSHGDAAQFHLSTVSKRLADNLQELLLKCEGRLVQFRHVRSVYAGKPYSYYKGSFAANDLKSHLKYGKATQTAYAGYVHCLELSRNGTMLVRRNGVVSWSGNCFREYIAQLVKYDKKFLIIGNMNAVTCKEVFKLIMQNKVWLGVSKPKEMRMHDSYPLLGSSYVNEDGHKMAKFGNLCWFTNLEHRFRNDKLTLAINYNPKDYPKYDNYDAIEVRRVSLIPCDWEGPMGVPITFLEKYNPEQFEILGIDRYIKNNPCPGKRFNLNGKEVYARIIIRNRNPQKG